MKKTMDIYLAALLEIVPTDALAALLEEYGYHKIPTAALLSQALNEKGIEFANRLGSLALDYVDTEEADKKFAAGVEKLSKATGKAKTPMTADEKAAAQQNAKDWFSAISTGLWQGVGSVKDLLGMLNGSYAASDQAKYQIALAEKEKEHTKQMAIWAAIGVVIAVILFFIFYKMFTNRH